jgi:pSer/pThr/pTyr-binding forkhead associated (FHA) protein
MYCAAISNKRELIMRKQSQEPIKPGQATLIVTYGNTTRKFLPLDRDLVVLGRTPVCDLALVSPEVAPVHCVLLRMAEGWRIRDCSGGRHATRVNGRIIQENALHDSDVLQIGTFTFEVRLPSSRRTPLMGSVPVVNDGLVARLKRLQRSRRNLARLALKKRQRAHKNAALPPTLAELERHAESLRNLQRDYEALVQASEERLRELEKVEREVCDERAAFEQECRERQARLDLAELDLKRKEKEVQGLLDRRSAELNAYARYLRRWQQQQTISPSGRLRSEPIVQQGSTSERLSQLHRLKAILALGGSDSAPGDQLRSDSTAITDSEQLSVDCTVEAVL